jgi:hypothetical protein
LSRRTAGPIDVGGLRNGYLLAAQGLFVAS